MLPRWVTFYLHQKRVVGVVTCNINFSVEFARKLIDDAREDLDLHEVAKLFGLYQSAKKEEKEPLDGHDDEKTES